MARVLGHLERLAGIAKTAFGGATLEELAESYAARGWQGDAASWEAVAVATHEDETIVSGAVRHLLLPWLDDSARAFQALAEHSALPGKGEQTQVAADDDTCLVVQPESPGA